NQVAQDASELNVAEQPWRSRMATRTREVLHRNMIPGVILQIFVITVVGSYYLSESVAGVFDQVALMKQTYGFYFSAVSTALFGGLIPFLVQKSRPKYRHLMPTSHVWFFLILWLLKGMEIDLLYRFQAMMFGSGKDILTVLYKVGFDSFIYVPLWGLTNCAIVMAWRQMGFNFGRTFVLLKQSRWWTDNLMAMLITNWMIWLVAVTGIYCLPLGLQLPVQNMVLCFWCILMIFLSDENM
ncbi:MAG: hypothetical protein COB88_08455, partial [Flavobacteriales bacterium]